MKTKKGGKTLLTTQVCRRELQLHVPTHQCRRPRSLLHLAPPIRGSWPPAMLARKGERLCETVPIVLDHPFSDEVCRVNVI